MKLIFNLVIAALFLVPPVYAQEDDMIQSGNPYIETATDMNEESEAETEERQIYIVESEGEVFIETNDGEIHTVEPGIEEISLSEGDRVKTNEGGRATIQIDDDNTIDLEDNSEFELTDISETFTKLSLGFGRLLAKFEEAIEKRRRTNIITPTAVLAIRGTEFSVDASADEDTLGGLAVYEGEIEAELTSHPDKPKLRVKNDQEIDFIRRGPKPKPRKLKRFLKHKQRLAKFRQKHKKMAEKFKNMPPGKRKLMRNKAKHKRKALKKHRIKKQLKKKKMKKHLRKGKHERQEKIQKKRTQHRKQRQRKRKR
ncbi:FecR domain-containing protein [Elusimicrobiota bacterium]